MKIFAALICLLLLGSLSAQTESRFRQPSAGQPTGRQQTPPASTPQIDPTKEAAIRRLLDLTGAKALAAQTMGAIEQSVKPLMTNSLPAGDYREKLIELFFDKFHAKADTQHLVDLAIPIYDKYLSAEEVKGLIQFYETPLGQKATKVMPQMVGEIQGLTREWGEKVGRESMLEVLAEHPELEQAMEAAQKAAQPQ